LGIRRIKKRALKLPSTRTRFENARNSLILLGTSAGATALVARQSRLRGKAGCAAKPVARQSEAGADEWLPTDEAASGKWLNQNQTGNFPNFHRMRLRRHPWQEQSRRAAKQPYWNDHARCLSHF